MSAQQDIITSIRSHLAASRSHDEKEGAIACASRGPTSQAFVASANVESVVELFKRSLEAVDGHCHIVEGESAIVDTLTSIIGGLQKTKLNARRIALSDHPSVERLVRQVPLTVEELSVAPSKADVFHFDVGITTAQAAIAETGTLVLDATRERHRVVSLVPPVHIAIIDANNIYETLGQTLAVFHSDGMEVSQSLTFVTGPSRTADIELTLTIGVHGPQELFVIVNDGPSIT